MRKFCERANRNSCASAAQCECIPRVRSPRCSTEQDIENGVHYAAFARRKRKEPPLCRCCKAMWHVTSYVTLNGSGVQNMVPIPACSRLLVCDVHVVPSVYSLPKSSSSETSSCTCISGAFARVLMCNIEPAVALSLSGNCRFLKNA